MSFTLTPVQVVFFDAGDTLVKRRADAAPGSRFGWVAGAKAALSQLGAAGVRLGLLSNVPAMTRQQLQARLPADFSFDIFEPALFILSSEVGLEKPDPAIFELAVQRAGVPAVECLFCTEELLHVLAAQQTGMRAAWVPTGRIKQFADELVATELLR